MRRLVALLVSLVVCLASASTTTASTATFTYDAQTVARVDAPAYGADTASSALLSVALKGSASPPSPARSTSTTPLHSFIATNTATSVNGGVYTLTDEAGTVVRTGRTNDLVRREAEHLRQYGDELQFNVAHRVDDYATQRGLEQAVYNQNPTSWAANGGLNKIRPISVRNPRMVDYENAATNFVYRGPR